MKNKIKTIIIVILLLWLVAYFSAKLINSELKENIINDGIAVINIDGEITSNDNLGFFESGVSSNKIISDLERANKNNGIKAVIIEINSPGGVVVGSREIVKAVKDMNKPVIALIRDVGASGAYWVASASDWIIADEMSITGSIGVYSSYLEFSGLLEKYNISYERLVAGEYKDVGVPYKKLSDREKNMMQQKLNLIHELFIKDIAANRNLSEAKVRELANGFFYLGIEAKQNGLIDELGGKKEAINKAKELGKIKDGNLVEYKENPSWLEFLNKIESNAFYSIGRGIGVSLIKEENNLEIKA